jgi:hypothetical protein
MRTHHTWRNTQTRMPRKPIPETPNISAPLTSHRSQTVNPSQVPSLRVEPRMNPYDVASPRVITALPLADVIPLTPHPDANNEPYMPQGMAGMNVFDTFEEEHMETLAIPRYNTRAIASQHSANQAHTLKQSILCPIDFKRNKAFAIPITQAPRTMPMANEVVNEDTGASLEYRHLVQDETTCQMSGDGWHK